MLARLSIRDIVLIERLDLDFARGLSVLTGETGAGKSILLDAFSLALGGRGDASLVRVGAPQGQVTAAFDLPAGHPARAIAAEAGLDVDGDLIMRRVQLADGRTRAFVNDQPVGVQALKSLGAALVEIHGQHDDRALVDARAHRGLLDAFGGLDGARRAVGQAFRRWREAAEAAEAQAARLAKAKADADYLKHAHEELTKLAPAEGEEEQLAEERARLQRAEKIASELADVHAVVAGADSPSPSLAAAIRRLERRATQAPELVQPIIAALDEALVALDNARGALEAAERAADFDPAVLERIEERLFALRAASRKYSVPVAGLGALAERYAADLAAIDAGESALQAAQAEAVAAEAAYRDLAGKLSAERRKTAKALDKTVAAELGPLKLERARFITEIATDPASAGPEGADRVEFWVETNPGTRPGPLMKIASGGELSRFLLALKVALADRGSAPTLVFDEIDSGVGGAVSDAIGARLGRLARNVQVLAVTHAPQVAGRADSHFLIAKSGKAGRVATEVRRLGAPERREEVARMLAGAVITDEARAAADRLLAS